MRRTGGRRLVRPASPTDRDLVTTSLPTNAPALIAPAELQPCTQRPALVAVVVHRRSVNATLACIASIGEHAPGTPVVLVVGSNDGAESEGLVARLGHAQFVEIVEAGKDDHEPMAENRGIDAALRLAPDAESILLLSAATRLRPGTLQAMRSCAGRRPVAGIVGCRVVARRGDPLHRGRALGALDGALVRTSISGGATECETTVVAGACMLVDAAVLRLGLRRDPSYQRSGADADLCLRVRAIGRAIWVTQAATVECDDDQVVRSGQIHGHARDQMRLALRTRGWFAMLRFLFDAIVTRPLIAVSSGRGLRQLPAYFGGLLAGLGKKPCA